MACCCRAAVARGGAAATAANAPAMASRFQGAQLVGGDDHNTDDHLRAIHWTAILPQAFTWKDSMGVIHRQQ
ncbi:hypothetical protein SPI_01154 [Niveomyces insectorum RCEF 264]|uniref:Uncharacterized protein n=1 Tax=Niveomyces insectorum RCEF 264 TaxID=1081102 RepID=A0A167YQL1_9HYPO|nr:hypothetical protein SPI_01154 [Niveomyces insectorum RCEF 264]